MVKLSHGKYLSARKYLLHNARDIDKAMFNYLFENGNSHEVLTALKCYQNEDKGFGNALEPDLRCKESSSLATTFALQYLSLIPTDDKLELVSECFEYLQNTFDAKNQGWEIIAIAANDSPRADWWNYNGFQKTWGNPNAEILGYFYEYAKLSDPYLTGLLKTYCFDYLQNTSEQTEMHELFCYIRLFVRLPIELQSEIEPSISKFIENCIVKNPADRNGYCAVPLQIVNSPSSYFYGKYTDVIPNDLDLLINSQNEDGTWGPNWDWGRYEEEWVTAKKEWKGYLTLNNLMTLKAFNRIYLF
ncbi:hypothetical protein EHS13_17070 [Paenibacillus psychroresistens]|uniref:Uncharacterized protein n=1 Tax=Paenibacillus psychroresistens TaxID=1778678 RepID=A0A6B8RLQ3_9BACL|nr:hypothetical protein [Paenibacillus psychroresistens]QGQ96473.1 hypothetical protein EHS13_17070 [Paenibacillus psychroresistens]